MSSLLLVLLAATGPLLSDSARPLLSDSARLVSTEPFVNDTVATPTTDLGKPFVAIVICATAKGVSPQELEHMALAQIMLPSVLRTIQADTYRYEVFVGLDLDDTFWMEGLHQAALQKHAGKLPVHVHFHGFPNKDNHIPFNKILKVAKDAGADFLVRVNDDTEFVSSGWTELGIDTLAAFSPPNVGVVGPTCRQGNTGILTHDMVHRTHMDIFHDKYYPPEFDNWYLDDWITQVYGAKRTTKLGRWEVNHNLEQHGTRYVPNVAQQRLLPELVERGRKSIEKWLDNDSARVHHLL